MKKSFSVCLLAWLINACSSSPSVVQSPEIKPRISLVPQSSIDGLPYKISTLPRGKALPLPQVLSHLGLWKYRYHLEAQRHLSAPSLGLSDDDFILFIAAGERKGITREDVDALLNNVSYWDRFFKKYQIDRIIYRGEVIDLE